MSEDTVDKNPIIRAEAQRLVNEWLPWGVGREKSHSAWSLGSLGSIYPGDSFNDGSEHKNPPFWFWIGSRNIQGFGTKAPIHSLEQLRATAISILVFCEAEEMRVNLEREEK
jgi:hypothetical protein